MNIGVDIRSLLSPTGRGVSHYTASLLEHLIRSHPDDRWQLLQTGRRPFALPDSLSLPNVVVRHVRAPNKLLNAAWTLQSYPPLERRLPGVEVFFAPNIGFVRLPSRLPLVTTVHDLSFAQRPDLYSVRERLWHRAVAPQRLLAQTETIIAVSGQTKRELIELYRLPAERIRVIHSGVDEIYHRSVPAEAIAAVRRTYSLPDSYVLFLGALEPRKNLPRLLEAFALARQNGLQSELVLAGEAGSAASLSHRPGVHVLGYVAEGDKPALYAAATSLACVSLHEGFGFPPLEALAAGTPSLVSELPVFSETLGEAALRVDPHDTVGMAEKLVHLEGDQVLRHHLLEHAPDVLRSLTWQNAAAQTYEVIKDALHAK